MKRLAAALGVGAGLLLVGAARAAPYTIFVYEPAAELALRTDAGPKGQAYWADYARFGETLKARGAIRGGAPLAGPAFGRVLGEGGALAESAFPAVSSRLQLSGYFIIEAADLDTAAGLAALAPAIRRGGVVDVRPTAPAPTMSTSH